MSMWSETSSIACASFMQEATFGNRECELPIRERYASLHALAVEAFHSSWLEGSSSESSLCVMSGGTKNDMDTCASWITSAKTSLYSFS